LYNRSKEIWDGSTKKDRENGLYRPTSPSDNESIIDLSTPTPPQSPAPEYQLVIVYKI